MSAAVHIRRYRLVHYGEPMPLPRARVRIATGPGGSTWPAHYLPADARRRKEEIAGEWQRLGLPLLSGPLVCIANFACSRPASHLGSGANTGQIKPRYRDERPKRADIDNLAKLCLDALQGIAFANDDQVVRLHAEKLYTDQAGLAEPQSEIELRPLAGEEAPTLFAVSEPKPAGPYEVEEAA